MEPARRSIDSSEFTRAANDYLAVASPNHDQASLQLGLVLVRAANLFVQESERRAQRPVGLRWSALSVTFALALFGPLEASTIARLTGVTRQAIALVTRTLERDGLVTRTTGADRRGRPLELTEAGRAAVVEALDRQGDISDEWFGGLTPDERATLHGLLGRLIDARRDAGPEPDGESGHDRAADADGAE